MNKQSLGDRMKGYESCFDFNLPRKSDIIIRLDGKAFHTFTRKLNRPFDSDLANWFVRSIKDMSQRIQGFKLAYYQSDEVSIWINDLDSIETEAWFGNRLSKILSISASLFTAFFNHYQTTKFDACFDSRAFVIPSQEVANYFIRRQRDWERNSIQMYAQSVYSQKELNKKSVTDMHEMLHEKGLNRAKLDNWKKNGMFILPSGESKCSKITYDTFLSMVEKQ